MTQNTEQGVRSREEQISSLWDVLSEGKPNPNHDSYSDVAAAHIDEAEARGAAEQQRKDGEGQGPYAWGDKVLMMKGRPFTAYLKPPHADPIFNLPLYTRPANVAALEDRVRVLEEQKGKKQEEARRYRTALMNICEKTSEFSISHKVAQAALNREGVPS